MKQALTIAILLMLFASTVSAGIAKPWTNMQEYTETINDPEKNMAVNEYVYRISDFIKEKCPPEYCKHVLIIGDDYVIPLERKMIETENGSQIIYSDGIYAPTTNRGVGELQDILEGETEIALVVPSSMDSRFRQAIDNMKNNMTTEYGLDPSVFEEHSDTVGCSVNSSHVLWNKSVIIIGENNALLNCSQFWRETTQVFQNFPSPWGYQSNPKKQVTLIKTDVPELVEDAAYILDYDNIDKNFRGRVLDTDRDGWTDEEELLMGTDLELKSDNYCTRMPSLKPIVQQFKDISFWQNILGDLTGQAAVQTLSGGEFTTQSIYWPAPLISGVVIGGVLGITGGIESDIDFVFSIPELIGGILTIIFNPTEWYASADYTINSFFDPLGTKCELVKKGIDTGDAASKNYFNEVLPSLYTKSAETRIAIRPDLDADDQRAFDSGFVTAYHVGFILEQIVVLEKTAAEAGKVLKESKFLAKATQAIKYRVLAIIGESGLQWSNKARIGLERMLTVKGEQYYDDVLKTYGDSAVMNASEGVGKGAADISKLDPEKATKYTRNWNGNPFSTDAGIHEVQRMYNAKSGIVTQVGNETIDGMAVLKKGQHLGPNSGFGWDHMVAEGHNDQIKNVFNLANNDVAVKEFLNEGLEKGIKNGDEIIWKVNDDYELRIIMSNSSPGSIQTAMPRGIN